MKTTLFFLAFFASHSALASAALPDTLRCTTDGKFDEIKTVVISGIVSGEAEVSIYDAPLMGMYSENGQTEIAFSNQCDNAFTFLFSTADLEKLGAGQVASVEGILEYFSPDMEGLEGATETPRANVRCGL